ncbi:YqaA family protein [Halomonas saccharevitans]|uniref:Membrane protein YqaA, SNARE-associated domain n=1 Tax=Halomonas saccharevitans TaxID=416872 RepID=A0A1I6YNG4_9GAMM|nr:YqaA family protein [Halomonas saccharevitans]MDT8878993.1 YqaA family protein [Halomonas saccharevitans]SFT51972.1 membrane protein YqaA, SNARE-associated domain [Halomonas saccharevitans]
MLMLFLVALASATLLPGGSEVWLARLWCQGEPGWWLWGVASVGNTLGSLVNVGLGRYARHFQDRRWFPVSRGGLERAERWYLRFGEWSLLAAWAPLIGDPLTVLAGILRLPWWRAILLIAVAKGARYALVLWLAEAWLAPLCA